MNKRNSEGYNDPTAYEGLKPIFHEENELDHKVHNLIKVIQSIVHMAGFEVIGRIQIKHKQSGKEYR